MPKILGKTLIGDSNISFVNASLISVPNTQIQNRAQIRDLSADMGARLGIERIMVQDSIEIPNEFGPNGERVYRVPNDDRDMIRLVGSWPRANDGNGIRPSTVVSGDFIEIVFYGTALNLLGNLVSSQDIRVTVDGGAEGANIANSTYSTVLSNRGYSNNQILPIVSGLSTGLHTVKIRNASANGINCSGFEIINDRLDLRVNAGKYIKDQRASSLDVALTQAYKPTSLTGTKGGRVVVYNQGTSIGTAVQAVDTSQLNLTSTNHANEEIVRRYFWREFGTGRADDFSLGAISNASRAGTLEDGATTLVGSTVNRDLTTFPNFEVLYFQNTSSYINLTFIGTGLDIVGIKQGSSFTIGVTVDGTSIGSFTDSAFTSTQTPQTIKIVSGLPYGTHTVSFQPSAYTSNMGFISFIAYQPKKPTLPSGAVEICDYCVVANYTLDTSANFTSNSAGIVRKSQTRESVHVGGDWTTGFNAGFPAGWQIYQSNFGAGNGEYVEMYFFGTGFDHRFVVGGSSTGTITCQIDGSTNLSGFTTSFAASHSINSFTAATGVIQLNTTSDFNRVTVSGLTLGWHKVRFTTSNNVSNYSPFGLDVMTPIHSHKSNLFSDLQNSLPVGNCALQDSRQLVAGNVIAAKAWSQAVGVTSNPTTSSTSPSPVPDMSVTLKTNGGLVEIFYSITSYNGSGAVNSFRLYVDGAAVTPIRAAQASTNFETTVSDKLLMQLPAGVHKIDVYWNVSSGTATAEGVERVLSAREL